MKPTQPTPDMRPRPITMDDPPQFPCWCYQHSYQFTGWIHFTLWEPVINRPELTHWHPDQSDAPNWVMVGCEWVVGGSDAHRDAWEEFKCSAAAPTERPTETETPETDAAQVDKARWSGQAADYFVPADFARRLERERDQARRALFIEEQNRNQLAILGHQLTATTALLEERTRALEKAERDLTLWTESIAGYSIGQIRTDMRSALAATPEEALKRKEAST